MKRIQRIVAGMLALVIAAACASPLFAWHAEGHNAVARGAVAVLPDTMPEWFRKGAELVAHTSNDPDAFKNPSVIALTHAEQPEHFLDLELLGDEQVPATRMAYYKWCFEKKLDPGKVGTLPYAIQEWTQRLTVALAEHRKWPENEQIKQKCLVYAGILAHYSGDLCQPLHVTIHYDGRADAEGKSPKSGIHPRMDDLLGRVIPGAQTGSPAPRELLEGIKPQKLDRLFGGVMDEIKRSHARIDRVYELEKDLPVKDAAWKPTDAVKELAIERYRAAAAFTASLYLTAWEDSASPKAVPPEWLDREKLRGK